MLSLVRAQLTHRRRRFVSVLVAVVIGTAFTAATLTVNDRIRAGVEHRIAGPGTTTDVIVTGGDAAPDGLDAALVPRLTAVPGVLAAERSLTATARYRAESGRGWWNVATLPSAPLRWFALESGSWPTGADQIAVTSSAAKQAGLVTGARLRLHALAERETAASSTTDPQVTVSGIVSDAAGNDAWGSADLAGRLDGSGLTLLATTSSGSDPAAVAAAVSAAAPAGAVQALTGAQYAQQRVAALTDGVDVLGVVLLCFAAIALLVAGLVIANVFTILLTARRQELALLRCLGATPGQVTRQLLGEGATLGLLGAVIGVALGAGVGVLGTRLVGVGDGTSGLPVTGLLLAGLAGLLVTVVAAIAPAVRTARVSPLDAWRPVAAPDAERRAGRLRLAAGLLLAVGGGAGLLLSAQGSQTLVAVGAAAVSAIGVLLLTRSALPLVIRLLGPVAGLAGPTGRLAAAQARRTPARSSAAAGALLVGVTLIVTLQVAAATAGASLSEELDQRYPVAVTVTSSDEGADGPTAVALPTGLLQTARDTGLRAEPVAGAVVRVSGAPTERVLALAPSAAALGVTTATTPAPGTALVPGWWGLDTGTPVTLSAGGRTVTLRSVPDHLADAARDGAVVVAPGVLQQLAPGAPVVALWASAPEGVDVVAAQATIRRAAADEAGVDVAGSALERADLRSTLDTVLLVATALLGVALVIAVVGIATTLSLSVLERTRETGVLRALGMTRGELRRSIAVEALLLSAVGALVGVLLGIGYGLAGARSVLGEAGSTPVWSVPWPTLAAVVVGALLAGLLASVLPARRAGRVTPAAALAEL